MLSSSSSSFTLSVNFFITPFEKWALLANYSSTSLCIASYWVICLTFCWRSSSLKINFSVCLLWYSNSLVSWWFWRIVSLVVVSSCYFFNETYLVCISLIYLSMSSLNLSVAWTFSLSLSASSRILSYFSFFSFYFNSLISNWFAYFSFAYPSHFFSSTPSRDLSASNLILVDSTYFIL